MIINIDSKTRIRGDSTQWTVESLTNSVNKETGEPVWKQLTYHITASAALTGLVKRRIRDDNLEFDINNAEQVLVALKRIQQITDECTRFLNPELVIHEDKY